jgi:hypothetical protein
MVIQSRHKQSCITLQLHCHTICRPTGQRCQSTDMFFTQTSSSLFHGSNTRDIRLHIRDILTRYPKNISNYSHISNLRTFCSIHRCSTFVTAVADPYQWRPFSSSLSSCRPLSSAACPKWLKISVYLHIVVKWPLSWWGIADVTAGDGTDVDVVEGLCCRPMSSSLHVCSYFRHAVQNHCRC